MTTMTPTATTHPGAVDDRPRLLDVPGAADYLGVSVRVMRDLRHQRLLPCVKVGHRVFFRPDDLDAYVAAQLEPAIRGPLASAR